MKVFGMRRININGNNVYTIKVRIKNNEANASAVINLTHIKGMTLSLSNTRLGEMIEINYFNTDFNLSNYAFKQVGKALKQVQLNNIDKKYAWAEVQEPEPCDLFCN